MWSKQLQLLHIHKMNEIARVLLASEMLNIEHPGTEIQQKVNHNTLLHCSNVSVHVMSMRMITGMSTFIPSVCLSVCLCVHVYLYVCLFVSFCVCVCVCVCIYFCLLSLYLSLPFVSTSIMATVL